MLNKIQPEDFDEAQAFKELEAKMSEEVAHPRSPIDADGRCLNCRAPIEWRRLNSATPNADTFNPDGSVHTWIDTNPPKEEAR